MTVNADTEATEVVHVKVPAVAATTYESDSEGGTKNTAELRAMELLEQSLVTSTL